MSSKTGHQAHLRYFRSFFYCRTCLCNTMWQQHCSSKPEIPSVAMAEAVEGVIVHRLVYACAVHRQPSELASESADDVSPSGLEQVTRMKRPFCQKRPRHTDQHRMNSRKDVEGRKGEQYPCPPLCCWINPFLYTPCRRK